MDETVDEDGSRVVALLTFSTLTHRLCSLKVTRAVTG